MGEVLRKCWGAFFDVDYRLAIVYGGAGNNACLVMSVRMQTYPCITYYA